MATKKQIAAPIIRHSISIKTLNSLGACFSGRLQFSNLFGPDTDSVWFESRVPITVDNLFDADEAGLDVEWLMIMALTDEDLKEYQKKVNRLLHDSTKSIEKYKWAKARLRYQFLTTKWHPLRSY